MEHRDIQKGQIHVIHNFEFADITERDSYIPSSDDLKKICLVNSPFSYYALRSISPTVWEGLGGGTTSNPVTQSEITKSSTNPSTNTNPTELGALWVNYTTNEIFVCKDNTTDQNVWKGNNKTTISTKPFYKFDILENYSAVSFLQLDDDLIDMGGAYDISEHNTIFETGRMGNCLKTINQNAKLDIYGRVKSISFWAFLPKSVMQNGYLFDCRGFGYSCYTIMNTDLSISSIVGATIYQNKNILSEGKALTEGEWVHIAINLSMETSGVRLINGYTQNNGLSSVKIDHVRCFNRALTSTDLDKLFLEA